MIPYQPKAIPGYDSVCACCQGLILQRYSKSGEMQNKTSFIFVSEVQRGL
jgi:hypothetical protein